MTTLAEYVHDGDTYPTADVMEPRRGRHDYVFVFDGPEGGELVVEFDRVYYDDKRLVFVQVATADRKEYERKVFAAEHWGQWGDVSRWFVDHGVEGVPRRFR